MLENQKIAIESIYRTVVGSLLWLSISTCPDISAITSMLARHQNNATPSHLGAAKHVLRYLKGTADKGIIFSSIPNTDLKSFTNFDITHHKLFGMLDANWGPQDSSVPSPNTTDKVQLSTSRSQSRYYIPIRTYFLELPQKSNHC